ncbi:MAG: hypothetical protein ACR2M1_04005 [Gemmatimonadaceae bacterium]
MANNRIEEMITMPEPNKLEQALAIYSSNRALQEVAKRIPTIGPVLDSILQQRLGAMRTERLAEFFEELGRQSSDITPEQLNDNDFCHSVIITMNAACRASRTEKVHMFARLLTNYRSIVTDNNVERYEEMLRILDDTSMREYHLLLLLHGTHEDVGRNLKEANDGTATLIQWRPVRREYMSSFGGAPPFYGGPHCQALPSFV